MERSPIEGFGWQSAYLISCGEESEKPTLAVGVGERVVKQIERTTKEKCDYLHRYLSKKNKYGIIPNNTQRSNQTFQNIRRSLKKQS